MSTRLKVVLNMSDMSITEKINKAQLVLDNLSSNSTVFTSPGTVLTELGAAIAGLRAAQTAASDGGKTHTAVMHDKEEDLMKVMRQVAAYVDRIAKDDAGVVHLAGLDIKRARHHQLPEFHADPGPAPGSVRVRCRAQEDVFYKFQYSPDPRTNVSWVTAVTGKISRALITGLAPGFYWFRVVLVDANSEHTGEARRLAVE